MSASKEPAALRFTLSNGLGERIEQPTAEDLSRVLAALDPGDEDRSSAWVTTGDDYVLEYDAEGRLVLETPEGEVTHLRPVTLELVLALWAAVGNGDLGALEAQPWQPGNGYVRDPVREAAFREALLGKERAEYDALGAERPDVPCRAPGCGRGAVEGDRYCRPHAFARRRGKPSPFSH